MADIKPMLNELKNKLPSKEQVIAFIDGMDLQVDTKKIKETTTKVQTQIADMAEAAANNPKVQEVVTSILGSNATNQAMLKLKEVLPNQDIINKIDMFRLAFLEGMKSQPAAKTEAPKTEAPKGEATTTNETKTTTEE